jgi:hypothetical protein
MSMLVQDDIANAVAKALKATIAGGDGTAAVHDEWVSRNFFC